MDSNKDILNKSVGQIAYERDLAHQPNYEQGHPRPTWAQLSGLGRYSWERNPTDRHPLSKYCNCIGCRTARHDGYGETIQPGGQPQC